MFVIPSIDILNGKCVQLINGRVETAEVFGSPQDYLKKWVDKGAKIVHIVDLDAAFNTGSNKELIFKLLKNNNVEIQIGGGIREKSYACELISKGAKRIIIGSKALDLDFLKEINKEIPKEQIMAALDLRKGVIVSDAWRTNIGVNYSDGINKIREYVGSILSTDVGSEGLLKGINSDILKTLKQENIPIYVSGGFTTKKDIEVAEKIGFSGVIVGRALYKEKLDLKEFW